MTAQKTKANGLPIHLRTFVCLFLAFVLAMSTVPTVPRAYAADDDKAEQVVMQIGTQTDKTDVAKQVATLNTGIDKGTAITFEVKDKYNGVSADRKKRQLILEDSSGKQTTANETNNDKLELKSDQMAVGQKFKLITLTKGDGDNDLVKRYEQQLNVRVIDATSAEKKPSATAASGDTGISKDGGEWSFSNGLQYTFRDTGFKFLDNTSMNLGALKLPLKYKHNADGTTIVGINCSPEDVAFYKAVKNGNVWQKFSSDDIAKKTSEIDKGWSGKKFGTWGNKGFDWSVCGYMEFNTNQPNCPRAVNLIISAGMSAEGHAQYLVFTGTATFKMGGKAVLTGTLTPASPNNFIVHLGAYASIELYIGLGLQYVASVGAYGKGQIDIDFKIRPEFYLNKIKLSGELGAKAKVFGFTVYTWRIWQGEKPLYDHAEEEKKKAASSSSSTLKSEAVADSPFTVSADTAYPLDSRAYLDDEVLASAQDALAAEAATSSSSILQGIYGETDLSCVTTKEGPVIAYIADAAQVGDSSRDAANRSVVVYTRYRNGAWTSPKIIDTTTTSGKYADYSPSISTDGENCYVTWLAADSQIGSDATIGDVGKKLDVNVATITKDDKITVEKVCEESNDSGTMPASPQAVKVGDDLYVGWYTNQTSGQSGEVIGVSGTHNIRLYKKSAAVTAAAESTADGIVATEDEGIVNDAQSVSAESSAKQDAESADIELTSAANADAESAVETSASEDAATSADGNDATSASSEGAAESTEASSLAAESLSTEGSAESTSASGTEDASSTSAAGTSSTASTTDASGAESTAVSTSAENATAENVSAAPSASADAAIVSAEEDSTNDITAAETAAANWTKVSEVTSGQSGAITSFDVGSYGGTAACAWSLDENFSSSQEEITLNGVHTLASSNVYYLAPNSTQAQIVAQSAANAQFAKCSDADVLTYVIRIDANDGISNPYLSVQSSSAPGAAGTVVLDGAKVNLPTPYYTITGDMGKGRAGNISFLKAGNNTCDIQALVTTGAGATDWTSIVEATADTATISDYCATYVDGNPLFIYTTERTSTVSSEGLSSEADDDGSVDLNQTTEDSLKHLSVTDVDFDEYEADSDQNMPVTVDFENDGLLDVSGVDLWVLEDGTATKVTSSDSAVALDDEGSISFLYSIPSKDTFTKAHEFTVYAAPAGATVTADKITREIANESAQTVSFGAASLSLEADHQIVDDQESVVATVTNNGIAPHGAKLLFVDADTDQVLKSVEVPELGENETFTNTLTAESNYFQNSGVKNITITLEDDGTESEGYEINNTEFVSTWDVEPKTTAATETTATKAATKVPSTADSTASAVPVALIALVIVSCAVIVRDARKAEER